MRRSYLRVVITSVALYWLVTFGSMQLYTITRTWTESFARQDGVFHVHETLASTPPAERPQALTALRPNFRVPFELVPRDDFVREFGALLGEPPWHRRRHYDQWWALPFDDDDTLLVAGPVNRAAPPPGYLPVGLILMIIGLPLLAATVAVRFDREVALVEEATDALATGELGARVASESGATRELSLRFNAMATRLERLIRSRDELVQAVSHELGSPLSRLRFHLELLEDARPEAREQRREAMTRELDALDALVAELLTFVQADDRPIDRTTFDPAQGLEDLAELARLGLADDRALTITVQTRPGLHVYADQRLFLRAVENLLRNAVQHATGHVRLTMDHAPTAVVVHIDDDGPGIPEEMRQRVTEPFARIHADRGRQTGGVGLGLAIVHRILERHEGTLEVTDAPTGGARFVTTWPDRR
jgi:signal transduction histidine kinase